MFQTTNQTLSALPGESFLNPKWSSRSASCIFHHHELNPMRTLQQMLQLEMIMFKRSAPLKTSSYLGVCNFALNSLLDDV
jgi:hypothetical protein